MGLDRKDAADMGVLQTLDNLAMVCARLFMFALALVRVCVFVRTDFKSVCTFRSGF